MIIERILDNWFSEQCHDVSEGFSLFCVNKSVALRILMDIFTLATRNEL